jgi:hypothetical protein
MWLKINLEELLNSPAYFDFKNKLNNAFINNNRQQFNQTVSTNSRRGTFVCFICLKKYRIKTAFDHHIRMHIGGKPYKCECGRTFLFSGSLDYHRYRFCH